MGENNEMSGDRLLGLSHEELVERYPTPESMAEDFADDTVSYEDVHRRFKEEDEIDLLLALADEIELVRRYPTPESIVAHLKDGMIDWSVVKARFRDESQQEKVRLLLEEKDDE